MPGCASRTIWSPTLVVIHHQDSRRPRSGDTIQTVPCRRAAGPGFPRSRHHSYRFLPGVCLQGWRLHFPGWLVWRRAGVGASGPGLKVAGGPLLCQLPPPAGRTGEQETLSPRHHRQGTTTHPILSLLPPLNQPSSYKPK